MIDIIYENFLKSFGIIILFSLSNSLVEYFVENLTSRMEFENKITTYLENDFKSRCKNILIKGLLICIFISFMASRSLGKSRCEEVDYTTGICETYNEDSMFTPTDLDRVGTFTLVFTFSFSVVLTIISKAKKKYYWYERNIEKRNQN